MAKVLTFKMMSGEEVVAEVVEEIRETQTTLLEGGLRRESNPIVAYKLRRPHILRFQQVAPGQIGLAFIPWTLANPTIDTLEVPTKMIGLVYEPGNHTEEQYLQQTSGLTLAKDMPAGRIST